MKKIYLAIILAFSGLNIFADSIVKYNIEDKRKQIITELSYLIDKDGGKEFKDIRNSTQFIQSTKKVLNFGITSNSVWLKFKVKNNTNLPELIVDLNQPIIDFVEFYVVNEKGSVTKTMEMGEAIPFSNRIFNVPDYLFMISISPNETKTIFINVKARENLQTPLYIGDYISIFDFNSSKSIISGIYIGIMLVMALYNLFIFFIFKDSNYIKYSLYIVAILFTQTSLQNYPFQFVWPNYPILTIYSPFFLPAIVGILGLEFFKGFLKLKTEYIIAYKISLFFLPLYAISMLSSLFGFFSFSFFLVELTSGLVAIFMFTIALQVYRRGYRPALFFLIGWVAFLIGIIVYVLKDFEILPYNNFTRYGMHFGSGIEVILLSFALADRINILKKEKEESQLLALKAAQENERLVTEQNILLEQKVTQRTEELENTNHQLEHTLNNLKSAQTNLVEAEKMASLGQLTAGIAHEINNPINFVSSNIYPLKLDFQDVLSVIDEYDKMKEGIDPEIVLKNVESLKETIDYEFVKKEIDQLLKGIEDGAQRTFEIVQGLKNFSYLDEADHKPADLNNGIKSTLVLLTSLINGDITIEKDFGDLPLVECYPGKLNQVFMNILSNAIQAIKSKQVLENEKITIKTFIEEDNAVLVFSDTGTGIPEHIRSKIFDPFFTTKDVGQGTGLGLSIVYNIIKKHDGSIVMESEVGKGTCFTIKLPLSQKVKKS